MAIIKTLLASFFAVSVCISQNVTISGKVTDSSGVTAIPGAMVCLAKGGLPTITDTAGKFVVNGTTGLITSHFNKPLSGKITATLQNSYMHLSLREQSNVELTTYSIQGKVLSTIRKNLTAGNHLVSLSATAPGLCFYRIKSGNEEFVIKSNSLTGTYGATSASSICVSNQSTSSTSTSLVNQRLAIAPGAVPMDVDLLITKGGYDVFRQQITTSVMTDLVIKLKKQTIGTLVDIDGNVYTTIKIGTQEWTVENLRVKRYTDGTEIPLVTDLNNWYSSSKAKTPAYCYPVNTMNADSIKRFGAFYNWYTISPTNVKKIAPEGWHVATDAEWTELEKYLVLNGYNWDGTTDTSKTNKIAKSLASKTVWQTNSVQGQIGCNLTLNNRSGFSAFPSGYREDTGNFYECGYDGYWWSATANDESYAYNRTLNGIGFFDLFRDYVSKGRGMAVRLVKD